MSNALIVLADGFEDIEAVAAIDVLRRGGVDVDVASLSGSASVASAHGLAVAADGPLSGFGAKNYDAIILPGGGKGTENLMASAELADLLRRQKAAGRRVCAICAAPAVLSAAGAMDTERFTCYPGMERSIGRESTDAPVVTDSLVTTGRGPGAAVPFALEILRNIESPETARRVASGMLARDGSGAE